MISLAFVLMDGGSLIWNGEEYLYAKHSAECYATFPRLTVLHFEGQKGVSRDDQGSDLGHPSVISGTVGES
jgi:hypothetical protein